MHHGQKTIVDVLSRAIGEERRKTGIEIAASKLLSALQKHGEWDDGCFYYSRMSAPELQEPMMELAAALHPSRES